MQIKIVNQSGDRSVILHEDSLTLFWCESKRGINLHNYDNFDYTIGYDKVRWINAVFRYLSISVKDEFFDEVSEHLNDFIEMKDYK